MLVYTIGYKGKSLETFINQLRAAQIGTVIDIRLRNTSHLAGYTKRDDLAFLLQEGFDIAYEHHPELAPTAEIREAYLADGDWVAYEAHFVPLLRARQAEIVGEDVLLRYQRLCLLCAEAEPDHCHRRLVAEYWAAHLPDVRIVHL